MTETGKEETAALRSPHASQADVLYTETLRGGQMWSRIVRRGQHMRLVNTSGGSTPAVLLYNPHLTLERYNMPDTLKAQHIGRLSKGSALYSDMGRIFFTIEEDTYGWHDTVTGHMTAALSARKYGEGPYQNLRNDFYRNTRDNFLVELGKYGLGEKDIVPNVNFFVKVVPSTDGKLRWKSDAQPGDYVDLRAEMDTLVVLSNTPHPWDPSPEYAPKGGRVEITSGSPADQNTFEAACPENERGLRLTATYVSQIYDASASVAEEVHQ